MWARQDSNRRSTGFFFAPPLRHHPRFLVISLMNCTGACRHASLGPKQRSTSHLARLRPPLSRIARSVVLSFLSHAFPRFQGFPSSTTDLGSLDLHLFKNSRSSFRFLSPSGSITGISSIIG